MNLDMDVVKRLLRSFDFEPLFIELGWDHLEVHPVDITVDHETHQLEPIAQKRGVQVYVCWADRIPGAVLRHKIDSRLTHKVHEHLLIFAESDKSRQVWQWVAHESGQPHFLRSFEWRKGHDGNVLVQRLSEIAIPINEEESIDLTTVTHRLKDAFDRDHVTKRFYERFAKERERFQTSISGLPDDDAKWYTSVIVDRVMFIYFLQKQGFLADGDQDYLRGKLDFIRFKGPDQYYEGFLSTLFFEGFAKPKDSRSAEDQRLVGNIPYLNGGLFSPHPLEIKYEGKIQIPDVAFDRLLTFFDQYQWTLDDRPLGHDNEINPDVLGYIFEKYVNQKQMGAYYTKEDITGYISQETIIPRLFDMVRTKYKLAFTGERSIFTLLKDDPDTYIYASMCKGARDEHGNKMQLLENIAQGQHDVSKRGDWNKPADPAYALPTEIWREVVARTQRYEEVHKHCTDGDITDINDLITYNLDMRQFAQDAIAQSDDPVFILEFYKALTNITVLDPTCGSGAFLFAALNILSRLYEVCLQRMEQFQQDGVMYTGQALKAVQQFDGILREADKHSNRRYYILKSIVVHNLYGVDIMEEAVEICKLRLFLRLVAELKPGQPVEPLPDIDFNIKAGNTLVGYAHLKDAVNATEKQLFGKEAGVRIQQKAEDLARLYRKMQEQQMTIGGRVTLEDKRALQQRRNQLIDELDDYLAYDYGIQTKNLKVFQEWRLKTHPFHWFGEFFDIIEERGGFDAIIGNPPYLETRQVDYTLQGYACLDGGAVHAICIERSLNLLTASGNVSMIVPLSLPSTQRMKIVQELLEASRSVWYANFAWRPAKLFDTVNRALTVFVGNSSPHRRTFSTNYQKWFSDNRDGLFQRICYVEIPRSRASCWAPKLGAELERGILSKCLGIATTTESFCSPSEYKIYYRTTGGLYWKVFTDFAPTFLLNGVAGHSSRETCIKVAKAGHVLPILACLSSDVFWWWYSVTSNVRDLNPYDIGHFPIPESAFSDEQLRQLGFRYVSDIKKNSRLLLREQKQTGTTETQSFKIHESKSILDEIDHVMAVHYGFSPDELDFITNYDIKYRMGADNGSGVDE
jgi:hypothetical protein